MSSDKNYQGTDVNLETSLEEYGFVARPITVDYDDEYFVIYKMDDNQYGSGHIRESELDAIVNGTEWASEEDVNSMLETVGATKEEWFDLPFTSKFSDLVSYWGTENIMGTDYYPNDKNWAFEEIGLESDSDDNDDEFAKGGGVNDDEDEELLYDLRRYIYEHRHTKGITAEIIDKTKKGFKVKQIDEYGWGNEKKKTPRTTTAFYTEKEFSDLFKIKWLKDGYSDGGGVERLVGSFYYDTRKDKTFRVISVDGTDRNGNKRKDGVINIGIQYYDKNKQPIGSIESIDKDTFDYYVSMGAWGEYKQSYFKDGGMFEAPIGMMKPISGKVVGSVPVSEDLLSSEVKDFIDYVYEAYKEDGFTKEQVKKAVNKYLKELGKEYTYGGGDSLDRERVYQFLLNPNLKEIKNPTFAKGGGVKLPKDAKIRINWVDVSVYKDSWEEGETDNVNNYDMVGIKGSVVSPKELIGFLAENIYTSEDISDYVLIDNNIHTSVRQDADGMEASKSEIEEWKKGNLELFSANYVINVSVISEIDADAETLSSLTGIGVYKKGGKVGKYAKGGGVDNMSYENIYEVLKDKIDNSIDDLGRTYENSSDFKGEEVEHKFRDGFIPYTNGGYEASWFEYVSMLNSTGYSLPTEKLKAEMQRHIDYAYELAIDTFKETYPEIVDVVGEDNIDYNSLYEAGFSDEAEQLSEWEMENMSDEDSIHCSITAYYYEPTNDRGQDGKHTISLQGVINLEAPYHRAGRNEDFTEIIFTFDSMEELNSKMDDGLKEVIAWFNGDKPTGSDDTFAKGGGVGKVKLLSDKFEQVGYETYARNFGVVQVGGFNNDEDINILVSANIVDMSEATGDDKFKEKPFVIFLETHAYPEFWSNEYADEIKDMVGDDEIDPRSVNYLSDAHSYGLGVPLSTYADNKQFKTEKEAIKFLNSEKLNSQISSLGILSGFHFDKAYNRIGDTGWSLLYKQIGANEEDFADGGDVGFFKSGGSPKLKFFNVYNSKTKKTLKINAPTLAEAKMLAEEIDYNDYEDGEKIDFFDWFWNHDYRHYLRDASPKQRSIVKQKFIDKGLKLNGSSPQHAYIVISTIKPSELKKYKKVGSDGIEFNGDFAGGYKFSNGGGVDEIKNYNNEDELIEDALNYINKELSVNLNRDDFEKYMNFEDEVDFYKTKNNNPETFKKVQDVIQKAGKKLGANFDGKDSLELEVQKKYFNVGSKMSFFMNVAHFTGRGNNRSTQNFFVFPKYFNKYKEVVGGLRFADGGGVDDFKMSYDEMTTYEKSNHIHYNPMNSRWEVTKNGENKEFWNQEQAEKFAGFEFENEKDARYSRKKYEALFGYADGGSVFSDMTEKEFLKEYFGVNTFTSNPSEYFDIKKLSSSNDSKVENFISELKRDGYSVKKKSYSDFTSVMGVKKKDAFANGGILSSKELDLNHQYTYTIDKDNNGSIYKEAGVYFVKGFENGKHFSETFEKLKDAKDFFIKKAVKKHSTGGGVDDADWIEESLIDLQNETGFDDLVVENSYNNQYTASNGDAEFEVFETEDDARERAIERVKEDLEENPEYFNRTWIMNYIDGKDFFERVFNEWNESYVNDIESEDSDKYANRLIEEMVENGIISSEEAKEDDFDAEDYKDSFVELLTNNQIEEGYDGLQNYIDNFGEEQAFKVVVDNNLIDIDRASESAVDTDGIAHFLSSYDGEQIDLSNGHVAYRTN